MDSKQEFVNYSIKYKDFPVSFKYSSSYSSINADKGFCNALDIEIKVFNVGLRFPRSSIEIKTLSSSASNANLSLEEWEALNWRSDEDLKRENKQDGITDMLSLTSHEIFTLASLIHSLMMSNPNGTGYQIKIGKW